MSNFLSELHDFHKSAKNNTQIFNTKEEIKSVISDLANIHYLDNLKNFQTHIQQNINVSEGNQTAEAMVNEGVSDLIVAAQGGELVIKGLTELAADFPDNPGSIVYDVTHIQSIYQDVEEIVTGMKQIVLEIPIIEKLVREMGKAWEIYSNNPNNLAFSKFKAVVESYYGKFMGHNETISHGIAPLDAATKVTHQYFPNDVLVNTTIEVPVPSSTVMPTISTTMSSTMSFTTLPTMSMTQSHTQTMSASHSYSQSVESISASPMAESHSTPLTLHVPFIPESVEGFVGDFGA